MEQESMVDYSMGLDGSVFRSTNAAWTNPLLDSLMPALSWAGNVGLVWFVLLGGIAVLGKETGRRIAFAGLVALVVGFASSELMKEVTMRPRPFAVLPDARLLVGAPDSYAFPSGHTTSAFAAAGGAVLAAKRFLRRVPAWGWGMLALAAAISYSRLYVGVHWPSDVAAGIVLGLASGWLGFGLALRAWRRPAAAEPKKSAEAGAAVREVEYREVAQRR